MDFSTVNIDFNIHRPPVIVAEVGVNHNCDMDLAKRLVDEAHACGADIVKFQAFIAEEEISRFADKAAYQKETTGQKGNQLEMVKALELSHDQLREIKTYCDNIGMPFLCTAFDEPSLQFLIHELGVKTIKIASSEVTNHPFLQTIARTNAAIILSTGASSLSEVADAVSAIQQAGNNELMLLHCVSNYPADKQQLNLRAITTMRERFGLPVGYSDHSSGTEAPVVATALGAVMIEKHFTLDRNLAGPDHQASIEPDELSEIVTNTRATYEMLGDGIKQCAPCEKDNQPLIRKSLVAGHAIRKGSVLTEADLRIKRPATGVAPYELKNVIGRKIMVDLEEDEALDWSMLSED